jgi:hypothetical protein
MASKNPETEQAIKQHCADAALRKLVAAGCEERTIIGGLSLLRDSCQRSWDSWESLLGQAWPGFRGNLRRQAESSIRQIREAAIEMEKLENAKLCKELFDPAFNPRRARFFISAQALKYYADIWAEAISVTGPKTHPFRLEAKAGLVAYVKEATGDWHDEECSALIAAATGTWYDTHAHLQWRSENEDSIRRLAAELRQTNHPESA